MEAAFTKPAEQVLASFGVDATNGLSDEQVLASRAKHGKNGTLSSFPVFHSSMSPFHTLSVDAGLTVYP